MKRLLHRLLPLLVLAAVVGLYQLTARYPLTWDATQNALNSLEPGSVEALRLLDGPLTLTAFVPEKEAAQGDVRKLVREFVALYQRYKSDITLTFVDPIKEPEAARRAGIRGNGELLADYGGRREHIGLLNEQTLTSALLRLARGRDQQVLYLNGHGERKLDGQANHDLGEFGRRLEQNGYHLAPLNLAAAPDVPDNIALLVITHPQVRLLPGETAKLLRFIERGGNLLWLLDAEPLRGLEPLAEALGLQLPPGLIYDPAAQEMNVPADWTLGTGYAPHPVTRNFDLITVFPYARPLLSEDDGVFTRQPLVEGATTGWASTARAPRFDPARDMRGPFVLALALQRTVAPREQRIVVAGSGSFLANAYSGNGGNLDLGNNMVNWLAGEERLITLTPHPAKDTQLHYSKQQLTWMSLALLVVLPLLLLALGGWQWWRRRTA
ncbi:MAG: hypothetical protein Fur0040_07840 [Sideroxydans sp.]